MPTQTTDDRGSATLLAIGVAFVLLGGCLVGVLWAAISVAHHRADAAADLAALTAAQALQAGTQASTGEAAKAVAGADEATVGAGETTVKVGEATVGAGETTVEVAGTAVGAGGIAVGAGGIADGEACLAAARVAELQQVELQDCQQVGETVSVVVAVKLNLGVIGTPVLTGQARAGPVEGGDWPGDG